MATTHHLDRSVVHRVSFSPDGLRLLTASWDHTARLWDAVTGEPLGMAMRHEREVDDAVFSPDGRRVITTSKDFTARIWDAATGRKIIALRGHENAVHSAAFSQRMPPVQ